MSEDLGLFLEIGGEAPVGRRLGTYNAAGRLSAAINGSANSATLATRWATAYTKTTAAGTTRHYDESGPHLWVEYDGAGNAIRNRLGDTPVAKFFRKRAAGIFYIHWSSQYAAADTRLLKRRRMELGQHYVPQRRRTE